MFGGFFGYSIILQALALIHFARRRPDTFWLWIIIMGSGVGALAYIVVEVLPDLSLLPRGGKAFSRRSRIKSLERMVEINPAAGNFEELGDLYLEDKKFS